MSDAVDTVETGAAAARPVFFICTVGGSPQPIATALRLLRPAAAWFLVSDGKSGESSRSQVEEREIDYDKRQGLRGPGLGFVEGCPPTPRVIEIPADDPDRTYALCRLHLTQARRLYPEHELIADYTGGTKSMTGALLMAALAESGVKVQFMLGERPDLVQVQPGTEKLHEMPVHFVTAEHDLAAARLAVEGYHYAAAYALLERRDREMRRLRSKLPDSFSDPLVESFCERLKHARLWAKLMTHWDAFRHDEAAKMVPDTGEAWLRTALAETGHLEPLRALAGGGKDAPGWDICADLWLNALRRGEQGRYDDAVARLYRLVEAAAQVYLWEKWHLKSGRITLGDLPDEMRQEFIPGRVSRDRDGEYAKLALNDTVRFLRCRNPDDRFAAAYEEGSAADRFQGPGWLTERNLSILAHGFKPVSERVWKTAKTWSEEKIKPFFPAQANRLKQLPRAIPPLPEPS